MGSNASTDAVWKLDSVSFDQLVEDQDPFGSSEPVFDLSGVRLVTPSALVELAAACYALADREPLICVDDASVSSYMVRAGFVDVVRDVAEFDPPIPSNGLSRLRGSNPMLIEVTLIQTGFELPALLNQIIWVLRNRFKYHRYDAFDVATAVSEVAQNTLDHNSDTVGFIAMQVYRAESGRFLEIGVADCGHGFAETLNRNPKSPRIETDLEAIHQAMQLGTSEHDDPTRGTGLYHLLEIAYKHHGVVQIRSGEAKVRYRMDERQGWDFDVPWMPGVQIALNLAAKKKS